MSLFDWFKELKEKSPFNTFQKRIERLKVILSVMEKEVEREYFQQLKGHLNSTLLLIGSRDSLDGSCLVKLLEKEKEITATKSFSQEKVLLQKFEDNTERYLEVFVQTLRDAIQLSDSALRTWQNKQLLQKIHMEIKYKLVFLEGAIVELRRLANDERKLYSTLQEKPKQEVELPTPLNLEGTMSNGWRLSMIQKVVRELGAWVEPAGKHAYKIIIPWASRPHPLSKDLDPNGFAQSLAKLLGIPKQHLTESFNKGELIV